MLGPRIAMFESWRGRYTDSPRAISQLLAEVRPDIFGAAVIGTYEDGRIEHVFNERPVFTRTSLAKAAEAAQHVANGASIEAAYRLAGYSEAEAMMIARSDMVDGIEQ